MWRDGARPAQSAFGHLACTLAMFEPVTVTASRAQVRRTQSLASPELYAPLAVAQVETPATLPQRRM